MTTIDSSVLGKILLLQGSLGAAPDEARLAQMLSHTLAELPGVAQCVVCIEGHPVAACPPAPTHPLASPARADAGQAEAVYSGYPPSCPIEPGTDSRKFALRTSAREYGEIVLDIQDASILAPYEPFVANTVNLAALHIENSRNARALEDLNQTLEARVQKRTKSLRESEGKYRRLTENSPAVIFQFLMEPDGTIRFPFISAAIQGTVGVPAASVQQDPGRLLDLMYPEDRSRFDRSVRESADSLEPWHGVARFRVGGREIWLEGHSTPEFQADGSVLWDGFLFDVTDRKHAEAERERLASAIEQASEVIVITDTGGTIQYVNPAFERVTGYTPEEALGQNPRILKSGEHDESFYREMWDRLVSGETWQGRIVNRKKDGTHYTEEAVISPVRNASGHTVNYVAAKRDVTEELRLEQHLRQAQKVESIGRLAGGVAHDLNNLLSPILGYGEMLQDDLQPGNAHRRLVDQILKAGFRARDLVRQLLAFSRRQMLQVKTVDLNRVITDFELLLRRTIREDVRIVTDLWRSALFVRADVGQIEQVIMNVAVNAADAMPEGGTLTITTDPVEPHGDCDALDPDLEAGHGVRLRIRDTGCGMDETTRQSVFEPFFSTKGEAGTGLGLATVYGIVKQHGGSVSVRSELGRGTTFEILLPVVERAEDHDDIRVLMTGDRTGTGTILLVEDNDAVRELATDMLERHGYQVVTAQDGAEALQILETREDTVHLLLTDVIMPGMSGQELYGQAVTKHPHLKVLYMSGYAADVIAPHGVLDGTVPFIQKPFTMDTLAARVRHLLG